MNQQRLLCERILEAGRPIVYQTAKVAGTAAGIAPLVLGYLLLKDTPDAAEQFFSQYSALVGFEARCGLEALGIAIVVPGCYIAEHAGHFCGTIAASFVPLEAAQKRREVDTKVTIDNSVTSPEAPKIYKRLGDHSG